MGAGRPGLDDLSDGSYSWGPPASGCESPLGQTPDRRRPLAARLRAAEQNSTPP